MTEIAADERARRWTRFCCVAAAVAAPLFILGVVYLLAVDPYDSGRFRVFGIRGLPEQLPHTANASRSGDPRFDTAIFGNSHVQPLKPQRLSDATGLRFVTLMMPGSFAADQLTTLEYYLHVQASPRAIVLAIDEYWCRGWSETNPLVPPWLYATSFVRYLTGIVGYRNLREANKRVAHILSGRGGIRPDGYWDYSDIYRQIGLDRPEKSRGVLSERRAYPLNPDGCYPDIDRLTAILPRVPADTRVVFLFPPTYVTAIPVAGTGEGGNYDRCRRRIRALASSRPNTALLDLTGATPANADPDNFYDWAHYRDRMALIVEAALSETLLRMKEGS